MIEVFKVFYPTHYNLAAVSILLVLLVIFLLTKKNYKWALIFLAVCMVYNVALFKKTDGKAWTITLDPEPSSDPYFQPEPKTMTFSVKKNWTIVDEKGEKHHWCWVEDTWESFAGMDLVAKIWGENSSKKMMKSSESRINGDVN